MVFERLTLVWGFTEPLNVHDTRADTAEVVSLFADVIAIPPAVVDRADEVIE